MSRISRDAQAQLAAARKVMDQYGDALQALATEPPDPSTKAGKDFQRQMEIARQRMAKYRAVYEALSRS